VTTRPGRGWSAGERYLLALLGVNIVYGVVAGIGLYFIGVRIHCCGTDGRPLRYVPYLGIWIAAAMPAAVAFGVEPGWCTSSLSLGFTSVWMC